MKSQKKIVVAVSGASGSIYANVLFDKLLTSDLQKQISVVDTIFSNNAKDIWRYENRNKKFESFPFKNYQKNDFSAPFASGSAKYDAMIICPCSMGVLGRIANGVSNDLISRAADVMLKERRKLILMVREIPYNLIHINNMKIVTQAGGIICPASPSFYSKPATIEEVVSTVTDRILNLAGFDIQSYRWNNTEL